MEQRISPTRQGRSLLRRRLREIAIGDIAVRTALRHLPFVIIGCMVNITLLGQATGVNLTLQYAHAIVEGDKGIVPSTTVGLGFQRDFQKRLGMGVDLNYAARDVSGVRAIEAIYSAKFFASDNDATACYIGSFIGVQSFSGTGVHGGDISHLQFPIGLRAGVRGGLEGYFGEIFTHVGYAIGNGTIAATSSGPLKSEALYFGVGFSFLGFGWE